MSEKQDLDLDFDDIVGKTAAVEEKQEEKVQEKKTEAKVVTQKVDTSIGLAFPVGSGKFKQVDLNTASDEDFLGWINYVFPGTDRKASDFSARDVRLRALKNVIRYHQSSLQWLRSQEKPIDPKKRKAN